MEPTRYRRALVVGAGPGLGASLARAFSADGMAVALAARDPARLGALGLPAFACDATDEAQVARLFGEVESAIGIPDVVVYNASARTRAPFVELTAADVERAVRVSAIGAFLVARRAVPAMLREGRGAILFTGASASVKGYPQSAPFAMGKFALRGLAESMARELAPQGIHVAHFVIDGGIRAPGREAPSPDALLDPDAIAQSYLDVLHQPRSAWSWELALRPWVEKF